MPQVLAFLKRAAFFNVIFALGLEYLNKLERNRSQGTPELHYHTQLLGNGQGSVLSELIIQGNIASQRNIHTRVFTVLFNPSGDWYIVSFMIKKHRSKILSQSDQK